MKDMKRYAYYYEYYIIGDWYCVVDTVFAYNTYDEMIDDLGNNCDEIPVPDYYTDDMIVY